MVINENKIIESKTSINNWISITSNANFTFRLGRINAAELSKGNIHTLKVVFELRDITIVEGKRLIIRTQAEGNKQGWTGSPPDAITPTMVFIDDIRDGEIMLERSFNMAENLTDDYYLIYCRVDGVINGEIRLKRAKFESGDQSTLYVPHRGLLTEEQKPLLKYGEYEQIQSF